MKPHKPVVATFFTCGLLLLSGCGGGSQATAPAPVTTPTTVAAAGTWVGTARVTSVTGGECGESLQFLVNSTWSARLSIQQNGSDVTAQTTLPGAATCTLAGSATTTGISLTSSRCELPPNYINYTSCSPAGGREFATASLLTALTITGNSALGTLTEVMDMRPVGGSVTSSTTSTTQVTLTRQ